MVMTTAHCSAWFIAAPASGEGKTTVTAAIARYFHQQNKRVSVFKIGPDYLDPMMLSVASGQTVQQLDLWMVGEQRCQHMLYQAAQTADLILIEGAMGLFDGDPSGADLAERFGIPVIAVINAASMAQTFAAIAHGLATFRASLPIAGILATQVRSDWHRQVILKYFPDTLVFLGCIASNTKHALPQRHLGLVQALEINDLDTRLNHFAEQISSTALTTLPPACTFHPTHLAPPPPLLKNIRIGIAKDAAFAFIYPANLQCLLDLGAHITYFSPLTDETLPDVDSLWFPGGYPELHLAPLSQNKILHQQIKTHFNAGKKIYTECGGLLYLLEHLTDIDDNTATMVSLIPGYARMQPRGGCQGMQSLPLPEGELRGHAHHRSKITTNLTPIAYGKRTRSAAPGEAIYRVNGLTGSYLHSYFPSNYHSTAALFC